MHVKSLRIALATLGMLLQAGCNESDLTSIRISLRDDGSGTIWVSGLAVPGRHPVEEKSAGASWSQRVQLTAASGKFDSISDLSVAGIRFDPSAGDETVGVLDMRVPVGPDAPWRSQIMAVADTDREAAAQAFDYTGRTAALAKDLKIVIEAPGEYVSSPVIPRTRGIAASGRGTTFTVTIPADLQSADSDTVLVRLSWSRASG